LDELAKSDPDAAKALRQRIVIIDFSARDPLSSYNLLVQPGSMDPEFFALSRADLIMDLLESDRLSLGGNVVLQRICMLLAEFGLPITWASELIRDPALRRKLTTQSKNAYLVQYFVQQFNATPKSTLSAVERRIQALSASETVRLALNGTSAPDFRELQDESRIVLINCFGENIARSVRRLLQALVLSDIRHGVFARRKKERPFLWLCDEAQNFFATESLRDNMHDLLTMSRSFGSFFLYLTQNMTTAVGDPRLLKVLHTNIRWAFAMRGDPVDGEFLASALPVTGQRAKPRSSPFEESDCYTEREERKLLLEEISGLSDRVGYLWCKAQSPHAIKLRTADLVMPQPGTLEQAVRPIRSDATVGLRVSRKDYERHVAERDRRWRKDEPIADLTQKLEQTYKKTRGKTRS
jgi:hypothetical protein